MVLELTGVGKGKGRHFKLEMNFPMTTVLLWQLSPYNNDEIGHLFNLITKKRTKCFWLYYCSPFPVESKGSRNAGLTWTFPFLLITAWALSWKLPFLLSIWMTILCDVLKICVMWYIKHPASPSLYWTNIKSLCQPLFVGCHLYFEYIALLS